MLFKLLILLAAFEPWGKDADLIVQPKTEIISQGPLQKVAEVLIGFHQNVISDADGPRSHFKPSSSEYTRQAIHKYGFFYGFLLGCDRLMRENNDPWIYPVVQGELNPLKYDPVR